MTKQVQRRRGTAAQHTSFTGAEGEISVNTTNKSVHVHDGTTAGGIEAARADLGNVSDANLNAALSGNTLASLTITSADINGGTIDGTVIGGSTPAAISGTTGSFSGNLTVDTNTLFVDAANNRVGVGTASPTRVLHLSASGTESAIRLDNTVSGRPFIVTYDDSQNLEFTNSSDAGYIAFRNGTGTGAERLRITSTGSVGIGTTSPTANLTAAGLTGTTIIQALGGDSNGFADVEIKSTGSSGGSRLYFSDTAAQSGLIRYSHNTDSMEFTTAGTERLRIDASGNVGIGLTNPGVPLHVKGFNNGNVMIVDATGTAANYIFDVRDDGTSVMRVDPSGNLLVGGTTAGNAGTVSINVGNAGATAGGLQMWAGTAQTSFVQFGDESGTAANHYRGYMAYAHGSDSMQFGTASTERMRIDSSGNLLVGTTISTAAKSTVESGVNQNTLYLSCPSFNWFPIACHNTATSGDNVFAGFGTEASFTTRGSITYNRAGGLTAYNTTSDYRAKDIAGPISDASGAVLNLKPYMGTMKGATVERPMFVAHETQEIAPYAVTGEKDAVDGDGNPKYQQMDHSALVPLLTAALQEALQKIEALEARITALEA
jgi:hypothetical protein